MKGDRTKVFTKKTSANDALREYLEVINIKRLQSEEVLIINALGRVLANNITSLLDVPGFDRSAVDGYAVRSEDTYGASTTNPVIFDLRSSKVDQSSIVKKLEAVMISTGAPAPDGTDAVIMLEYTEMIGMNKVEIYRSSTPWSNVSRRGEDIEKGNIVLNKGTVLQPQDIGILAAIGQIHVKVLKKPRVAIISSGNELIEPGSKIKKGKTIDVNRFILSTSIEDVGGEPLDLGIVKDNLNEIRTRISEGLNLADLVLVSGGTSVGERDLVPDAVNLIGRPGVLVHGMAIRPGMPTALASVDDKPIVLLPGYPVAALIGFNTFVRPIIFQMLNISIKKVRGQTIRARITRRVPSKPGIRDFVRVFVKKNNGGYLAEPIRTTGSGILSSMVKANGLLIIPEELEGVDEKEEVEITLIRHLED